MCVCVCVCVRGGGGAFFELWSRGSSALHVFLCRKANGGHVMLEDVSCLTEYLCLCVSFTCCFVKDL